MTDLDRIEAAIERAAIPFLCLMATVFFGALTMAIIVATFGLGADNYTPLVFVTWAAFWTGAGSAMRKPGQREGE